MEDQARQERRLARERAARKQAEQLLDAKSRELYDAMRDIEDSKSLLEREIEERKQTEEELRQNQESLRSSETRLNSIMSSVTDGLVSFDLTGVIQSANQAAVRIFGGAGDGMVGQNILEFFAESDRAALATQLGETAKGGADTLVGQTRETTGLRQDGSSFPLEITFTAMQLPEARMLVGLCRDITYRKQREEARLALERELSQAQKLESLGTLAGGIAHEINTPIQYVGDNIRFLNDVFGDLGDVLDALKAILAAEEGGGDLPDLIARAKTAAEQADLDYIAEEAPSAIAQSQEGIGRISEIVQAIKEFSHPDAKEKSAIDINKAIQTTATVARNQWKYSADIDYDLAADLPLVPCFPGELNQVILNLVVNAAHAIEATGTSEKGRIAISTRQEGAWLELRVADSGTGIPEAVAKKIFDPFFTTKEPGKGTGQGLSICHSIVTVKHSGKLSFESVEGQGTTFIVQLPLQVAGETSEAA